MVSEGGGAEDANSQIIGQLYMHFEHRILMDISGMLRPLHLKNSQGNLDIEQSGALVQFSDIMAESGGA